jgi:hypothetical protein
MKVTAILTLAFAAVAVASPQGHKSSSDPDDTSSSDKTSPEQKVSYLMSYVTDKAVISSMTSDPAAFMSTLSSEISHTDYPAWATALPTKVQAQMGMETTSSGSSKGPAKTSTPGAAPVVTPFGYAAAGLAAVAGVMAL